MTKQGKDLNPKSNNGLASIDPLSVLLGIFIMWTFNLVFEWLVKGKNHKNVKSKAHSEEIKVDSQKNEEKSVKMQLLHPDSPPLYAGLYNHGQTCYANTIIQSLYFVPLIRRVILSMTYSADMEFSSSGELVSTDDNMNRFVCFSIQSIFFEMQHTAWKISGDTRSISIQENDSVSYEGYSDHEILEYFKSISKEVMKSNPDTIRNKLSLQSQLATSPEQFLTALGIDFNTPEDVQEAHLRIIERLVNALGKSKAGNLLLETYQGQLIKMISCTKVECNSMIDENFFDISLEVKDIDSLEEALYVFLSQELLTGENEYQTESHGKQEAISQYHFKKLPQILTFNLKRFRYDIERSRKFKINSRFTFPLELDLSSYVGKYSNFEDEADELKYVLFAVFTHEHQYGGGHYYCFLKDPSEPSTHWIEMNDAEVHFVNQEDVIDSNYGGIEHHSSAYRLQYVRKSQISELFETKGSCESTMKKSFRSNIQIIPVPESFQRQKRLLAAATEL